jgi:hypothetical protein
MNSSLVKSPFFLF